jgi:hypothetical protein
VTYAEEPVARVGISRILDKVTSMEAAMAVQACAIQALAEDMKSVRVDVASLQGDRFPWKVIGGLVGLGALSVSIVVALSASSGAPPPPPR